MSQPRDEATGQYLDDYGGRHYTEHDAFKASSQKARGGGHSVSGVNLIMLLPIAAVFGIVVPIVNAIRDWGIAVPLWLVLLISAFFGVSLYYFVLNKIIFSEERSLKRALTIMLGIPLCAILLFNGITSAFMGYDIIRNTVNGVWSKPFISGKSTGISAEIASKNLPVHRYRSTDSRVRGYIEQGDNVWVVGKSSKGWAPVYAEVTGGWLCGYVLSPFLLLNGEQEPDSPYIPKGTSVKVSSYLAMLDKIDFDLNLSRDLAEKRRLILNAPENLEKDSTVISISKINKIRYSLVYVNNQFGWMPGWQLLSELDTSRLEADLAGPIAPPPEYAVMPPVYPIGTVLTINDYRFPAVFWYIDKDGKTKNRYPKAGETFTVDEERTDYIGYFEVTSMDGTSGVLSFDDYELSGPILATASVGVKTKMRKQPTSVFYSFGDSEMKLNKGDKVSVYGINFDIERVIGKKSDIWVLVETEDARQGYVRWDKLTEVVRD